MWSRIYALVFVLAIGTLVGYSQMAQPQFIEQPAGWMPFVADLRATHEGQV